MKRTHDQLYLKEDSRKVKDSFVAVADEVSKQAFKTIADVGCACGAFPHYIKSRFPISEVTGVEYNNALIGKAKSEFPEIRFLNGNVLKKDSITERFDVITMLGVLSIFDDARIVLENVLSWLNPGGRLILHAMVNDYNYDVFIKYKSSHEDYEDNLLESGWNIISLNWLKRITKSNNCEVVNIKNFKINTALKRQADLLRSWTEARVDGSLDIYNGLHIRQPHKIVTIKKFTS